MNVDDLNPGMMSNIVTDTVIFQHMAELGDIFGDGISSNDIRKVLHQAGMALLGSLLGSEDSGGVVQKATGTYGQKLVVQEYKQWFIENKDDVEKVVEMIQSMNES